MLTKVKAAASLAAALGTLAVAPAAAQSDWPSRPIVIVLAIGAGSGTDLGLRLYAAHLSKRLGVSVVVENRPGASTILGTEYGMRQQPNGYNLTSLFSTSTIVPATHRNVPFNPVRDFMPISLMARQEYGIAVTPTLPVSSLNDVVALAKKSPGKLTHASPGHGTPHHLGMELFKLHAGIDMLHVPHKSISDALNGVAGGHTDMILSVAAGLTPLAASGRMKLIAVTGPKRLTASPNTMTAREQGFDFLDPVRGWFGLAAPLKTPQAVITRLNREINEIARQPDFIAQLAKSGQEAHTGTPEEMTELMKQELEMWAKVVQAAKVEMQ